jgi:hypothetical protein
MSVLFSLRSVIAARRDITGDSSALNLWGEGEKPCTNRKKRLSEAQIPGKQQS